MPELSICMYNHVWQIATSQQMYIVYIRKQTQLTSSDSIHKDISLSELHTSK